MKKPEIFSRSVVPALNSIKGNKSNRAMNWGKLLFAEELLRTTLIRGDLTEVTNAYRRACRRIGRSVNRDVMKRLTAQKAGSWGSIRVISRAALGLQPTT